MLAARQFTDVPKRIRNKNAAVPKRDVIPDGAGDKSSAPRSGKVPKVSINSGSDRDSSDSDSSDSSDSVSSDSDSSDCNSSSNGEAVDTPKMSTNTPEADRFKYKDCLSDLDMSVSLSSQD